VALLIGRALLPLGAWNLALGAAALAAGLSLQHEAFNGAAASVIGFATTKPRTEDYVPLFPWLGVLLLGIGAASLWRARGFALAAWIAPMNSRPPRPLVWLGTWALTVYLVHQPLLLAMLWPLKRLG
jgi:uncharacterized membrane protein